MDSSLKILASYIAITIGAIAAGDGLLPQNGMICSFITEGYTQTGRCFDASGLYGAMQSTNARPIGSYAYSFNGAGNIAAFGSFVITNDFTVTAFVKSSSMSNSSVIGFNMGSGQSYVELGVGSIGVAGVPTNAYFTCRDTNGPSADFVGASINVRDGRVHNLTGVRIDTQLLFYVDGIMVSSTSKTANSSGLINATGSLYVGSLFLQGSGLTRSYNGTQYITAVWSRAVASNDIFRFSTDGIMKFSSRP